MNNKKILLILFAIMILGAFLRFYKLGQQSFVTDEFLDINAVYGYFKTGEWVAWDFNLDQVSDNLYAPRDERAWPYRIQVAQMFHFFPLTEATARSVSALWGVFSIIILYFISTYFTKNKTIGLISAFLFAVSTSGITFDRMLRMYAMFFPVFLLSSWFTFRFLEEEYEGKINFIKSTWKKFGINLKWFLPATLCGLLSFSLHPLTLNIGIIIFVYFIIYGITDFYKNKFKLNKYSVFLLLSLIGIIGVYVGGFGSFVSLGRTSWSYFPAIFSDYNFPILMYGLAFVGLYGLVVDTKKIKESIWLTACFFGILLSAVFIWNNSFGLRFIFFAMSFGIILVSSGIFYLSDFIGKYFPKHQSKVFVGSLIILLLIIPNYAYFFSDKSPYLKNEKRTDYGDAFGYFLENKNSKDVLLARNFRSFYYNKANVRIINKESDKKITLTDLKRILAENPNGWMVTGDSKGDLEKDALKYIEEISTDKREISSVWVYRWGK